MYGVKAWVGRRKDGNQMISMVDVPSVIGGCSLGVASNGSCLPAFREENSTQRKSNLRHQPVVGGKPVAIIREQGESP
jgi:hypothetical protein